MQYAYSRTLPGGFDAAVAAVEREIGALGFEIVTVYNLHQRLAAKGFDISPLRIYVLEGPKTPAGVSPDDMPCKLYVYEDAGHVVITALRPTIICGMFPDAGLETPAGAVEVLMEQLVDSIATVRS